jgi:hypothetical protein
MTIHDDFMSQKTQDNCDVIHEPKLTMALHITKLHGRFWRVYSKGVVSAHPWLIVALWRVWIFKDKPNNYIPQLDDDNAFSRG